MSSGCGCKAGPATGRIEDLSYASLMPRYAPPPSATSGLGGLASSPVAATIGWLVVGGVCGAALYVFGKELLNS